MTCIVGIIDKANNRVVIDSDTAEVSRWNILNRKDPKVFNNKGFIFGCTTSFRMIQLLRFSLTPPEIPLVALPGGGSAQMDIYEYMCTLFVDAVRECFKQGGFMQKAQDGDEKGGEFLVGYADRLFMIEGDFQVAELTVEFNSCGCGSDFALGSLYSTIGLPMSVEERVLKALETSEFYCMGVRGPFTILSTSN